MKRVTVTLKHGWKIIMPMKGTNAEIIKEITEAIGAENKSIRDCKIIIKPETRKWLMEAEK